MTDWLTASRSTWLSYGGSRLIFLESFSVLFKPSRIQLGLDSRRSCFPFCQAHKQLVEWSYHLGEPGTFECSSYQVVEPVEVMVHALDEQFGMEIRYLRVFEPHVVFQSSHGHEEQWYD